MVSWLIFFLLQHLRGYVAVTTGLENLARAASTEGFAGLELSLNDLGRDTAEREDAVGMIAERGLRLICGLYTGQVADLRVRATSSISPAIRSFFLLKKCVA